jgi:hypothetical protein
MADSTDGLQAHDAPELEAQSNEPASFTVAKPEPPDPSPEDVARAKELVDKECPAFYRLLITISTMFLGGTLAFIEKIVPHPIRGSAPYLGWGWALLIVTILAVVWVRWANIEAIHAYLRKKYDRSDRLQVFGRVMMLIAGLTLGVGMGFVMMFGYINFSASDSAAPVKENSNAVPQSSTGRESQGNLSARPSNRDEQAGQPSSAASGSPADLSASSSNSSASAAPNKVR